MIWGKGDEFPSALEHLKDKHAPVCTKGNL